MIKTIAKAICKAEGVAYHHSVEQDLKARYALEAMKHPTEEMLKAGIGWGLNLSGMYEGTEEEFLQDILEMMIDKALDAHNNSIKNNQATKEKDHD